MKLMKLPKLLSFRKKILIGMLLAAVLPTILGYTLMLNVFQISYKSNMNDEAETILQSTGKIIDSSFANIYRVINELKEDPTIRNKLNNALNTPQPLATPQTTAAAQGTKHPQPLATPQTTAAAQGTQQPQPLASSQTTAAAQGTKHPQITAAAQDTQHPQPSSQTTAATQPTQAAASIPAYRALYTMTMKHNSLASFSIYDAEGNLDTSVVNSDYIKQKLPLDWGVLYELSKNPKKIVVRNARIYKDGKKIEFLRIAGAMVEGGKTLGYVVATVNRTNFDNILRGVTRGRQGILYFMDAFNENVYCSEASYDENAVRKMKSYLNQSPDGVYETEDGQYRYRGKYLEYSQLTMYYQQPVASLNSMKDKLISIALSFAGISIVCCIFLSIYFSNRVYKPVQRMKKGIHEIEQGNFDIKIKGETEDEFGDLVKNFNKMSCSLAEYMKRLLQREHELSTTHIKMMQAQLNPHFLYNTLDTMKWLGKANDVPEVAVMASNLAKILRMSISAKPVITLREEIDMVEAYVEIQKIRFEDKFEFIVDLPEELEQCCIPKLILQPLVENAIIHGFKESQNGMVLITVESYPHPKNKTNQILRITVKDDGAGIDEKTLYRLNNNMTNKKSIGYFNVANIIRLNYGNDYGVSIDSEVGVGTSVVLKLPVTTETQNAETQNAETQIADTQDTKKQD